MDMIGEQKIRSRKAARRNADAIAEVIARAKEFAPAAGGAKPCHLTRINGIREMVGQIGPLNCHGGFGEPC